MYVVVAALGIYSEFLLDKSLLVNLWVEDSPIMVEM